MEYTDEASLVQFFVEYLYEKTKVVYNPDDPETRAAILAAYNADVDEMNARILTALVPSPPPPTIVVLEIPANVKYSLEGVAISAIEIRRVRWFQPKGGDGDDGDDGDDDRVRRYLYVGSEQFKIASSVVLVRLGENDRRVPIVRSPAVNADDVFVEVHDFDGYPVDASVVIAVEYVN